MTKNTYNNKIQALELQLEEAIHLIRLAAKNERTCLELEDWLIQNYPESDEIEAIDINIFLNIEFNQLDDVNGR